MTRVGAVLAVVALAGGAAAASPSGPSLVAGVAWGTTASAPAGPRAQLFGVGAAAPGDIWAVGGQNLGAPPTSVLTAPYAEHWNGSTWVATPVPVPSDYPASSQGVQLESVAAAGPSDVWAVGAVEDLSSLASRTLAYRWNGSAWSRIPTPNPGGTALGNHLQAVAVRSTNDVYAVGDSGFPARSLVLRWTGTKWSRVTTPDIGSLRALAVSPTTLWVASGSTVQARTAGLWNRLPALPAGSGTVTLNGLASSSTGLWAVGTDVVPYFEGYLYVPYAAVFNGSTWARVPAPAPAGLSAVAASGADVWATSASTVVRLTPAGGTVEVTPASGPTFLDAITADGDGKPWAVGWRVTGSSVGPAVINAPGIGQGGISVTTGYSGATVTWIGPTTGSGSASVFGTFAVGGLLAGSYTVVVSAPGCTPAVVPASISAGVVTPVNGQVIC